MAIRKGCRFRNKYALYDCEKDIDFKNRYQDSMNYLNNIIISCGECCNEQKCLYYNLFMKAIGIKYRNEVKK